MYHVKYKNAFENYLTGEPIFKALGWNYSKDKRALKCTDEYMLGTDILIKPIGSTKSAQNEEDFSIYLPAGKWLDAFAGKLYEGETTVARKYALRETPLFIRMGALLPLAHGARNTKEQKWDKLVYDFYPDRNASDEGYLYEDDTETTAYKLGQCRKSGYKAGYCKECNAYVVNLMKAEGNFKGEKCFDEREITFKTHLLGGEKIKRVTVNGEEVAFQVVKRDVKAFPMNADESAPDSDTVLVTVKTKVAEDYEVRFYL